MRDTRSPGLPAAPGVGFKPQHFDALMADPGAAAWVEVHAENYLGAGGRPQAQLAALAARFPVSIHGVGLSIGGPGPLDARHLARLRALCDRIGPAGFSEHLAWSTHEGGYLPDLLPLPYTAATLARVSDHVAAVQDALGRRILLENPATYLSFAETEMEETDFLATVATRTHCGLLLDVNNVLVACTNRGEDPDAWLARLPLDLVGEIHIAGHALDADDHGAPLLIDDHGAPVADPVWHLLDGVIRRGGPRPVLVEWDNDVPEWPELEAEAARAARVLACVP